MKRSGLILAGGLVALFVLVLVVVPDTALAQSSQQAACQGAGGTWRNGVCDDGTGGVTGLIQSVVNLLLFVIGAVAVIMLIIGGFRFVVSAGDANAIQSARNTIIYAIIGIVVAFLAYAAVNFVLERLG